MSIDYNAIGTWAAVVAVIIAAVSIWVETRRSIYSRGVDILLKYSSEFSGDDFLLRRRQFAQVLKKKPARKLNSKEQKEFVSLATFFLDHYEVVGFLLREKILDRRLTYVYAILCLVTGSSSRKFWMRTKTSRPCGRTCPGFTTNS